MNILAINTVEKTYSVALLSSNSLLFTSIYKNKNVIFKMIDDVLYNSNLNLSKLDLFIFNKGPGMSFTGIRLSGAIANVLNLSLGTKIVGISNLDIIFYKTDIKKFLKNILLIFFVKKNNFYICKYYLYIDKDLLFYINKKEIYINNLVEFLNLLKNLKGIWHFYINKEMYLNFFKIFLFFFKKHKNIKIFVKLLKKENKAEDLIFCIKLIYKFKLFLFLKIEKFLLPDRLNYIKNNIAR